ncbi:hypothetical protein B296_00011375 [Ensete ventricosum]|uniref:Uncharacterized protein n=1 Tax=Ensete ventricosum TaxID=4639 RepID=A0A426YHC7_ENSVE|nr:hypothetical protein B296_00011375 [Ensete ventricosum]
MIITIRIGQCKVHTSVDVVGTRHECVGSSLRVSGVCQDGAREFARRRLRLVGRLSRVAEKLAGKDHSTRNKNVEGCRISGMSDGCTIIA